MEKEYENLLRMERHYEDILADCPDVYLAGVYMVEYEPGEFVFDMDDYREKYSRALSEFELQLLELTRQKRTMRKTLGDGILQKLRERRNEQRA